MDIQARLYWRNIRSNMNKDSYFKDFELANYRFIVCNGDSLHPLVWEFKDTNVFGDLYYGKNEQIVLRDPYTIAKELDNYLKSKIELPINIEENKPNDIIEWLNKI